MTHRPYPAYKDSGIEWLGEVPEHWKTGPLKYHVKFRSGGTPSKDNLSYWEGSIPWASAKDMKSEVLLDTEDHLSQEAIDSGAASIIPSGSVVVVVRGMILARMFPVGLTAVNMAINQDLKAVGAGPSLMSNYLAWYFRGTADQSLQRLDEAGHGTKALRMEAWSSMELTLPPLPEQQAIAAFLDRETAKIDGLVAEQERLIELLTEKRQAVVSHAVTRGLDPSVPLKDSGVEWLGQVPEHWDVSRLRHVSHGITVGLVIEPSKYYTDSGIPAIRSLNVQSGALNSNSLVYFSKTSNDLLKKSQVFKDDIVIVRTGQPGSSAVVSESFHGCNCIDMIIVRRSNLFDSNFLTRFLNSDYARSQYSSISDGAIQQHFNVSAAMDIVLPLPPFPEQQAIAVYLDEQTSQFDTLMAEAQRTIELLKERRTALISAAVTGKIDVR